MGQENSKGSHHGHHHHHRQTDHNHHHDSAQEEESSLSPRDRLIIRLRHIIRHNHEHAATYRSMAEEAQRIAAGEAAHWILGVAEQILHQNEDLEKALAELKFRS
jgi:hypothetical protein